MNFKRGDHIGDYELSSFCGGGAYGEVFSARNTLTDERVALKILRPASKTLERELRGVLRFRECRNAHLIRIRHVERFQDFFYYTMDLADDLNRGNGEYLPDTLSNRLERQHRLASGTVSEIADALTGALDALHAHGLVHRDVKPDNILWINGIPVLGDAGLTAEAGRNSLVGTPEFMPVELLRHERDARQEDDFYALTRVLYCAFTGESPANYPRCPEGFLNADNTALWRRILEPGRAASESKPQRKSRIWRLIAIIAAATLAIISIGILLSRHHPTAPRREIPPPAAKTQPSFMLDRELPKLLKLYEEDERGYRYFIPTAEIHSRTFYDNLDHARKRILFQKEFVPLSDSEYRTKCDELESRAAAGMKRDLYLRLHECQLRLDEQLKRAQMYPLHAAGDVAENAERQYYLNLRDLLEERRILMKRLQEGDFAAVFALPHSLWNFVEELKKEAPHYHWGKVADDPNLGAFYKRNNARIREIAARLPQKGDPAEVRKILVTAVKELPDEEKLPYSICALHAKYVDCREWDELRIEHTPENIRFYAGLFRLNRELVDRLRREYPKWRS